MKDLKVRTITSIVLILIVLPVVYFGGVLIEIFSGLLSFGAAYELEKMFKQEEKWSFYNIFNIILSLLTFVFFILIFRLNISPIYILIYIIGLFLVQGILMIFTKDTTVISLGDGLITIFYPSVGFSALSIIRNVEVGLWNKGFIILVFVVLVCMFTDMFAYFVGSKFGKHKLCERISPKKTWEGSIGGTIFGVVISTVFAILLSLHKVLFPFTESLILQIVLTVLFSLLLSFIDEIGDLFASKLKRYYGIKDYSKIFPGHGGVLDRFDSYIFASTLMYLYLLLVVL